MRVIEKERLQQLKSKRDKGEMLTEKEKSRLRQLESQEIRERREEDGTGRSNSSGGTDSSCSNPSVGHSGGSGEESGKGESLEPGNGSELDSDAPRTYEVIDGISGQVGSDSGSAGSEDGRSDGSGSENGRTDGSNNGSQGRRSRRSRSNSPELTEEVGNTDLTPKDIKPRRARSKATPSKNDITPGDLYGVLISGLFQTVAMASGKAYWQISEQEAQSISKPLDQMLSQLSTKQKKVIEKYTAPAMLSMAVAGVIVPRVMIDVQLSRKGKNNVTSKNPAVESGNSDASTGNVIEFSGGTTSDDEADSSNLDPVIAGLFEPRN